MANFVNDAIMGNYECSTYDGSVGQLDFITIITEWWDSLDDMYKYAIIGGAGLLVIVVIIAMFAPTKKTRTEKMEELLHLRMMKELAE
jgi:hypothetical protein